MKRIFTLLVILLYCRPCMPQVIKTFTHASGYGLSATSACLTQNGYLVASKYDDGTLLANYITRYNNDGTVKWTKTENSGMLSGIMDMAENSMEELYFLAEDIYQDDFYGLIKTDSDGNILWSRELDKKAAVSYEAPHVRVNSNNDVFVMSSTYEKTHIYKLSDNGNLLWSRSFVIDSLLDKNPAFGMVTTQDGGVIYSGKTGSDLFVQRLDVDGNILWTKRVFENALAFNYSKAILALQDGNFMITGFRSEATGDYASGMFLMKIDGNGNILQYRFYYDSQALYSFIPYALYEKPNGDIQVMGCGGVVSFADFDASLNLVRYSVWNTINNFMVSGGCFSYGKGQALITGTDNQTTQYILHTAFGLGDFCNLVEINTMEQKDLSDANILSVAPPAEEKDPLATHAGYSLQNAGAFENNMVCGQSEITLGLETNEPAHTGNVYPNPVSSNGTINIDLSWNDESDIVMMDAEGRQVLQLTTRGYHPQLSTGGLPAGLYFLSVSVNENVRFTSKIIVY